VSEGRVRASNRKSEARGARSVVVHGAKGRGHNNQCDPVNISAFAPLATRPGDNVLIQIYLHQLGQAPQVARRARNADQRSKLRGVETLDCGVQRGQRVDIELEAKGLTFECSTQSLIWRGKPQACYFSGSSAQTTEKSEYHIRARVFVETVPVG